MRNLMQSARVKALNAIDVGDVIYGVTPSGRGKMLLVYDADEEVLHVRHVPSLGLAKIGRDGNSTWCEGGGSCIITSTAPLPTGIYDVVIGLDRKMRNAKELSDLKLSNDEIQILLTQDDYFQARPLPED